MLDRNAAKVAAGETVEAYIARRTEDRCARGLSSAENEPGIFRKHCGRVWGRPIVSVTRADCEGVVEDLDREVAEGRTSANNAKKVWKAFRHAFDDATNAKARSLRVLAANPAIGVRGPDGGGDLSKCFLYPSEFLLLVTCLAIPCHRRRVDAAAVYLYCRRRS